MKKAEIEKSVASLSDDMKYALNNALWAGEAYRQRNGKKALSGRRCSFRVGYRRAVAKTTARALRARGLVTQDYSWSYEFTLTAEGVAVARVTYDAARDEGDLPLTEAVAAHIAEAKSEADELEAKKRKAKKLWAGIKISTFDGKRAISGEIDLFTGSYQGDRISLDLDELISIGEQFAAQKES